MKFQWQNQQPIDRYFREKSSKAQAQASRWPQNGPELPSNAYQQMPSRSNNFLIVALQLG